MRKKYALFFWLACVVIHLSFETHQKTFTPHLIVGCWNISDDEKPENKFYRKDYFLDQICFGSDEFTGTISFEKPIHTKDYSENFAYKIYTDFPESQNPVILFKNTADKHFKLLFIIEKLDKKTLQLRFIPKYSSEKYFSEFPEIITLERTAGPPENMD